MDNKSSSPLLFPLALVAGLSVLGIFIFKGLKTFSDKDRIVTVKGLAEMNITATSAIINISYNLSGDDLPALIKQSDAKKAAIISYLSSSGISSSDINTNNIDITDKQKYYETEWQNGQQVKVKVDRYSTSQSLSIATNQIKETENKASSIKLDLVSKDLTSNVSTYYFFPELNSIKPKLIAESTKNARVAGEQFANDSKATLGKIKTASQGQITIAGKNRYDEEGGDDNNTPTEPYIQKARVVSTIVFFLE